MKWIELKRSKVKVHGKKSGLVMKGMTAPEEHTHFLQGLLTNDIKSLGEGQFNYNLWLKHNGAPVGDFYVYRFADYFLLDTEEEAPKVIEEFNRLKLSLKVFFEDLSQEFKHFLILGDGAEEFLKEKLGVDAPREFNFVLGEGFIVACNPLRIREKAFDVIGKLDGFEPEGDELSYEESEHLRIERCVPKIHKELREGFSPLEAGVLDYAISLTKGCYVGQEAIARVHFRGRTPRALCKFELRGDVAEGDKIIYEGKAVGVITSISPLGSSALGYMLRAKAQEEKEFIAGKGSVILKRLCS